MPVYKDKKTGTYTVRFYADEPLENRRKQVYKRGFKTKREATLWESQEQLKKSVTRSSASFWEIFQKQLENNDTSPSTRKKKEAWIRMYFRDFKDMPIENITKPQLIDWRNRLKDEGIAVRTMNNGLQYVRSVFAFYSQVYGAQNASLVLKSFKLTKEDKVEGNPF